MENQEQRSGLLQVAKNLKENGGEFARVFIRKDIHRAFRKEMMRFNNCEREERDKPANQGVNIMYDWQNRVLLRDGFVIDRYF